jgi:hypothetical protein
MKSYVALLGSSVQHPFWRDSLIDEITEREMRDLVFFTTKKPHENKDFPDLGISDNHLIRAYELSLAKKCRLSVWCPPLKWDGKDKVINRYFEHLAQRASSLIIWLPPESEDAPDEEDLYKMPHVIPYHGPLKGVADILCYLSL